MDLHKSQVCSILLNTNYYDDLDEVIEGLISRHYFNEGKILVLTKLRFNENSYDNPNGFKRSYGYQLAYYNKISKNITSDFYPSLIFKDNYLEQIPMNDKNFIPMALEHLSSLSDKVDVLILPNINEIFKKANNSMDIETLNIIETIKKICIAKTKSQCQLLILLVSNSLMDIPICLEPYLYIKDIPPLSDDDILEIINHSTGEAQLIKSVRSKLLNSFRGLKKIDIQRILKLSSLKTLNPLENNAYAIIDIAQKEKEQLALKTGLLEWIKAPDKDEVGGLENVRGWLESRAKIYDNMVVAKQSGVNIPKGMPISGIPGTGKSLIAKQAARIFNKPLVKMDMGRLMGKYLGESEENLRRALNLAEALSPCILWIDELEKSFSGSSSDGGQSDTFMRIFSTFLTWMQDKKHACFVIATANDVSKLPPEFLRKGRFDEKFCVKMPTFHECMAIFKVHLLNDERKKSISSISNLDQLISTVLQTAQINNNFFTGADIEALVNDAFLNLFIETSTFTKDTDYIMNISSEDLQKALLQSLNNTVNYGKTNLKDIALCYMELDKNKFKNAALSQGSSDYDKALNDTINRKIAEFNKGSK